MTNCCRLLLPWLPHHGMYCILELWTENSLPQVTSVRVFCLSDREGNYDSWWLPWVLHCSNQNDGQKVKWRFTWTNFIYELTDYSSGIEPRTPLHVTQKSTTFNHLSQCWQVFGEDVPPGAVPYLHVLLTITSHSFHCRLRILFVYLPGLSIPRRIL